jgi:hypothetical protein
MHRNRTWQLDSTEAVLRTQRNRILPIEGGDGSTLTLDFTTGQLDPRLTFTRASNGTFINSSGLVEWAPANMAGAASLNSTTSFNCYNTAASPNMETPTLVSGPNGDANTASSFTLTATGFIDARFGTSSISGTVSGFSIGITYTISYYFKATRAGSPIASVGVRVSPSGSGYQTVTNIVDVAVGNGFTYRTCQFVPTATSYGFAWAYGNFNSGDILVCSSIQVEPGTAARSYIPTSGGQYYAPRFDYTGGSARGLLIEGTATNLLQQSADWTVSPWSKPAQITWDGTTYATAPDGTNTAKQITVTGGSSASVAQGIANATNRTVSLWLRAGSLTTFSVGAFDSSGGTTWGNNADSTCSIISGPGSVTQQVGGLWSITGLSTTQWTRVQVFRSSSYGALLVYPGGTGTVTGTGFMWGMQMEAGNGASSLIPTGASQVQRVRDEVVLSNLSSISFNQSAGTVYSQVEIVEKLRGSFVPYGSFDTSGGGRCWWWLRHNHDTSVGQRILGTAFISGGTTAITSSNYTHSSGVFKFATSLNTSTSRMVYSIAGGSPQVTTTSAFTMATAAQMSLNKNNDVAATDLGSMWVRSIKYWPTALPDATLQSLTT